MKSRRVVFILTLVFSPLYESKVSGGRDYLLKKVLGNIAVGSTSLGDPAKNIVLTGKSIGSHVTPGDGDFNPIKGSDYLGIGYDVLMGNPSGDHILQIDPGFRAPVIALEYSPLEEQLLSRDRSVWVPTNGYYYPEQSCSRTQTSVKIVGMADYQRALGADASIAQDDDGIIEGSEFSLSSNYIQFMEETAKQQIVTERFGFNEGFSRAVSAEEDKYTWLNVVPNFLEYAELLSQEYYLAPGEEVEVWKPEPASESDSKYLLDRERDILFSHAQRRNSTRGPPAQPTDEEVLAAYRERVRECSPQVEVVEVVKTTCGNGVKEAGEGCDVGSASSPGCVECRVQPGYICTDGVDRDPSTCVEYVPPAATFATAVCGDGVRGAGEECDVGATSSADPGCKECKVQPGFMCLKDPLRSGVEKDVCYKPATAGAGGSGDAASVGPETCDNGIKDPGEGCDVGSYAVSDADKLGCIKCKVQPGFTCKDGISRSSPTTCTLCGNGRRDPGEECDDSNLYSDDGCDATCKVEKNYVCSNDGRMETEILRKTGSSTSSKKVLTVDICWLVGDAVDSDSSKFECGNGKKERGEGCDNGGEGAGCVACRVMPGYDCVDGDPINESQLGPSVCTRICGNGDISAGEECDVGPVDSPGCVSCKVMPGYLCQRGSGGRDECTIQEGQLMQATDPATGLYRGRHYCIARKWHEFFNAFGTHFISKVHVGGKIVTDVQQLDSERGTNSLFSIEAAKDDAAHSLEIEKQSANSRSKKSAKSVLVGGLATLEDVFTSNAAFSEWAKTVANHPMPIRYALTPFSDIPALNHLGVNGVNLCTSNCPTQATFASTYERVLRNYATSRVNLAQHKSELSRVVNGDEDREASLVSDKLSSRGTFLPGFQTESEEDTIYPSNDGKYGFQLTKEGVFQVVSLQPKPPCLANERVKNHECEPCSSGTTSPAGADHEGEDTECIATRCGENEMVSNYVCVACPVGSINAAGDDASLGYTTCHAKLCGRDEFVKAHVCTRCPAGKTNWEGDEASGDDTECNSLCPVNHRVRRMETGGFECKKCPLGQGQAAGGDITKGVETSCYHVVCKKDQYVDVDRTCRDCRAGTTSPPGVLGGIGDATQFPTTCAPVRCLANERVLNHQCVPCSPEKKKHIRWYKYTSGAGADASGADTECTETSIGFRLRSVEASLVSTSSLVISGKTYVVKEKLWQAPFPAGGLTYTDDGTDAKFQLRYLPTGNLCVYKYSLRWDWRSLGSKMAWHEKWCTETDEFQQGSGSKCDRGLPGYMRLEGAPLTKGKGGGEAGNFGSLVLYNSRDEPIWSSATYGSSNMKAVNCCRSTTCSLPRNTDPVFSL